MLIKCPQCSATNDVQKFCGNCGSKLLVEGVEINDDAMATIHKNKPKRKKWLIGIGWFLLVWLIGGTLLSFLVSKSNLDDKYVAGISFVLGLVALWESVRNKEDENEIEETNDNIANTSSDEESIR